MPVKVKQELPETCGATLLTGALIGINVPLEHRVNWLSRKALRRD